MFVVLDSNIWISELGLTTVRGAALLHYLLRRDYILAIPEVVKTEVEWHVRRILSGHRADIERKHRQLLSVFGKLKELVLPTEDQIATRAAEVFADLPTRVREIPFALPSARASFEKLVQGAPPSSDKNQQFKDGAIWADCMELLREGDVVLVTADRGFFQDRQVANGLASNLRKEAAGYPHRIDVFHELTDLLESITSPAKVDKSLLVREFRSSSGDTFQNLLDSNGFELSGEPVVDVSFYITEKPEQLYIEFSVTYPCRDLTEQARTGSELQVRGDAMYEPGERKFSGFRVTGETLAFVDAAGEQQRRHNYMFAGNVVIGHRTVEHTIRHRMEGG